MFVLYLYLCQSSQDQIKPHDLFSEYSMINPSSAIVQRLWNYCNVLRDDGMSYGDYLEQLTHLLFLKMEDENVRVLGHAVCALWRGPGEPLSPNSDFAQPGRRADPGGLLQGAEPHSRHWPSWSV
jgi:hypothetical protein